MGGHPVYLVKDLLRVLAEWLIALSQVDRNVVSSRA